MIRAVVVGTLMALMCNPLLAVEDSAFDAFLREFRSALQKNDWEAIATMTRPPFLFEGQSRDRAAFLPIVPQLFTPRIKRCFQGARPLIEGRDRVIFCKPYAFYSRPDAHGRYWLEEFAVDGEDAP